jgi:AcrR family transcriptional regulator
MRQTRTRIFDAAIALFSSRGVEATTVAEIAQAADIGKGTFFTYFPTKEAVFAEVSARLVDDMARALARAARPAATLDRTIPALFQPALDWHADNPALSRAMLAAFLRDAAFVDADRPAQQRLLAALMAELVRAREAGRIPRTAALDDAAAAIVGTYFGSLAVWHAGGGHGSLHDRFTRALGFVLHGLLR